MCRPAVPLEQATPCRRPAIVGEAGLEPGRERAHRQDVAPEHLGDQLQLALTDVGPGDGQPRSVRRLQCRFVRPSSVRVQRAVRRGQGFGA